MAEFTRVTCNVQVLVQMGIWRIERLQCVFSDDSIGAHLFCFEI